MEFIKRESLEIAGIKKMKTDEKVQIRFLGHLVWELRENGKSLILYKDGNYELPEAKNRDEQYERKLRSGLSGQPQYILSLKNYVNWLVSTKMCSKEQCFTVIVSEDGSVDVEFADESIWLTEIPKAE